MLANFVRAQMEDRHISRDLFACVAAFMGAGKHVAKSPRAGPKDKGFQLDAFSFSAVASAWAKIGDTAKAQATLEALLR